MGTSACKDCSPCDQFNDRFQNEKIVLSHCESVEDFLYYLPKHEEALETFGAPPIINVVNYAFDSRVEASLASELNEGQRHGQANVSLEDGEDVHRSLELIEGQVDECGLVTGFAKTRYKDLWTYTLHHPVTRGTSRAASVSARARPRC